MGRSEPQPPAPLITVRVSRIEPIALDTRLLELTTAECEPLPGATPGAHIEVHLSEGLVRHYSVLTPLSTARSYVIAVKRALAGRGGSQRLHEQVTLGSELLIGRPRNNFTLNESAADSILLAGGIGITPLYAMFERLQEIKRKVHLHYWSRSPAHTLFGDHLQCHPDVTLHHSAAGRETITSVLGRADRQCELYCCGPEGMLREFELAVQSRGTQSWHVERFGATVEQEAGSEFSVVLAKSRTEVLVHRGETILSALRDAAIDVAYSCEEGVCGACEVRFLAGEPLHRDRVRTAAEHDRLCTVMICCAGSKTKRLTLDL
jgi:vanillate O-demethylase ferredoxin subunit